MMQSSLIGKIEKAMRYAQETDRVTFHELSVNFRGENSEYQTGYKDGEEEESGSHQALRQLGRSGWPAWPG